MVLLTFLMVQFTCGSFISSMAMENHTILMRSTTLTKLKNTAIKFFLLSIVGRRISARMNSRCIRGRTSKKSSKGAYIRLPCLIFIYFFERIYLFDFFKYNIFMNYHIFMVNNEYKYNLRLHNKNI